MDIIKADSFNNLALGIGHLFAKVHEQSSILGVLPNNLIWTI
jgi:hypothetical protein